MKANDKLACAIAVLLPAFGGLACASLGALFFKDYGWALFLGVPLAVSFASGLLYRGFVEASLGKTYGVSVLSLLALGGFILLFAIDGLICLLMALPLALLLALPASAAGFHLAKRMTARRPALLGLLMFLVLPLMMGFESRYRGGESPHMVVSSIIIHAPIGTVWKSVIAFDPIPAPPRGIFRMGIAYPIEATIVGEGVGAIRHCVFSTGAFVEPITQWDEPSVLAFDVAQNPPPMKEFSIYRNLQAPHLHGTFTATKGQFKLRTEGGATIVEGTTWYHQKLSPDWYWGRISDEIVHRIHMRVLEHIKGEAEKADVLGNSGG